MRIRKQMILFCLLLGLVLGASGVEAKQAGVLLQEGLYAEEIDGDLDKAIGIYQQVAADKSATEAQAAHSLYRLGMCHLKKQDESKAKAAFEKILAEYPNQTNTVEKVKPLLEELVNHDPAALMPADTKVYVELGSPGKQIETILNMLKGTPLENPLQIMGGGQPGAQGEEPGASGDQGGQSPQGIIGSLMNPAMMAEFKKIRGLAVGINKINVNGIPHFTAVLNPGKSDALRGIILAALGMFGQQGQAIEGMQTVLIQPDPSIQINVAYDNNIILVAYPMEQLNWCVKQYKGVTNNPTLISQNQSFTKIPRQNRTDNALTIWLDGAGVYSEIPEPLKQAMEFRLIDRIGDLKSIEEILLQVSLQEQSVLFDTAVSLQEGHNCLPYNMMRTPNLSKTGFQGVPSNTVGLISFALGDVQRQLGARAQQAVEGLTGLDIGREIFANIEQVTIFVVPSTNTAESGLLAANFSPIVYCAGVAITSHNPQKTRQLLSQALDIGEMFMSMEFGRKLPADQEMSRDKYFVAAVGPWENRQPLYVHIGQAGKTTVLSLNPEIVDASVTAVQTKQSVLTGGPLHDRMRQLSGDTSKLALVNVGGAIRLGESHLRVAEFKNAEEAQPLLNLLTQLSEACEETSVQLRTGETVNHFTLQASINNLPSFGALFPLIMQLERVAMRMPQDLGHSDSDSTVARAPDGSHDVARDEEAPHAQATNTAVSTTAEEQAH
jgi:tetratricopeptide (TPR) repeat protein